MGAEVHQNDLGTVYQVPIYDNDLTEANFDPSSADVKELRFKMPGNDETIVRDATAAQVTIDGSSVWCLTYTVDPDEPSDVEEFHIEPGRIVIQAYIEYADGRKWSSNKITTDHQGRVLKVHANL